MGCQNSTPDKHKPEWKEPTPEAKPTPEEKLNTEILVAKIPRKVSFKEPPVLE